MSKQNPSEQNRWLIEQWARALQFEDAMESARYYYEQLFEKVLEKVRNKHPELRQCARHMLSQRVTEGDWDDGGGCAGFSSPKWHSNWPSWPSGIWIWNISLDELVTERAPAPSASIWLSLRNRSDKKIGKLRERLLTKSRKVRGCRALHFETDDDSDRLTCLYYDLREERTKLLDMVLQDNGRPFVECIASHVERMASLVQGFDDLLR
jgi:hypothetical protein